MPSNAQRPPPRAFAFAIQTEGRVMRILSLVLVSALALSACNDGEQSTANQSAIQVRSNGQDQLRTLDALNLAIALKHAIYDAGYTCKRITDAGFVGEYKNLDMWMAHCVYQKGSP